MLRHRVREFVEMEFNEKFESAKSQVVRELRTISETLDPNNREPRPDILERINNVLDTFTSAIRQLYADQAI